MLYALQNVNEISKNIKDKKESDKSDDNNS